MLWIEHTALCVVLVDHVFLGQLQVQVLRPRLLPVENGGIDLHALSVLGSRALVVFLPLPLQLF